MYFCINQRLKCTFQFMLIAVRGLPVVECGISAIERQTLDRRINFLKNK